MSGRSSLEYRRPCFAEPFPAAASFVEIVSRRLDAICRRGDACSPDQYRRALRLTALGRQAGKHSFASQCAYGKALHIEAEGSSKRPLMLAPANGVTWKQFFLALKERFIKDKLMDVAGSVTFFGVLALFPFLLFLVTLAGLVLQPQQVEQFIREIGNVAPADATRIIAEQIRDIHKSQSVGLLTVGFVGAIWSASGGVVSLMDALNGLHHVEDRRPFWKTRGLAVLTTFGASAAILIAALVGVAAGPIAHAFGGPVARVVLWLRLPVAGLLIALVWAVLYQVLPDVPRRFRFLTPGSVVAVAVWLIASWGFSFYVLHFGEYNKTYGAIGGAVVMLMWMWISAMVLLTGALINAVLEDLSRRAPETAPEAGTGGFAMPGQGALQPRRVLSLGERPAEQSGLAEQRDGG